MTPRRAALALTLLCLARFTAAQTPPAAAPHPENTVFRTFYLNNVSQVNDANQIPTVIHNLLPPDARFEFTPSLNAVSVRGTPETIALVQKILADLDRPRKPYRLTYTLTEMDNGKRIGTQHIAVVVLAGGRTTLKQGSKVPIATGTFAPTSSPSAGTQTQFAYLDIGLNIDASLDDAADGVRLRTKVEQSSLAEETSGIGPGDPIVRQTVLEGTSILIPGKPVILGSLDIPGSTHHLDIDVLIDPLR